MKMKNFQTIFTDFESIVDLTIQKTWDTRNVVDYLEELGKGSEILTKSILEIGDFSLEQLKSNNQRGPDTLPYYLIHFLWIDQAKGFLILWRNILFQAQKAEIFRLEEKISQTEVEKLKAQSKHIVLAAASDLNTFFEKEFQRISNLKKGPEKQISQWFLQQNPYPVYRKQLENLPPQCRQLLAKHEELQSISAVLIQIKTLIAKTISDCNNQIHSTQALSNRVIDYINENAVESVGKIPSFLEGLEEEIIPSFHINTFIPSLNDISSSFKTKTQIPINTHEGLLQLKEINFQKSVQQWLESQILPLLYEIWELTENAEKGLKMSFLNILNRTVLLSNEIKEGKKPDFKKENLSQPLDSFLKKKVEWEKGVSEMQSIITKRLQESFGVFSIYHVQQDFLPIPLNSTINQFKLKQNKWWVGIQNWGKGQVNLLQKFKSSVQLEETRSISEKIVRLIENRKTDSENSQYSGVFLTKGYIGETFWVGRNEELQHIETLITQWKSGYRGAVILTGQRFSGKSLFGDLVVNRYFPKDHIRLLPNTVFKVQGRQFNSTYDLGESLDFIRQHSLPHRRSVWIDDLELWSDPNLSLSQNVRRLCDFIDRYSGQIFFIVSMSNWLKEHLQNIHDIDKKFQVEINLDRMNVAEVQEAILIRHGATHKVLVNEKGKEISPQAFQKITDKIYKITERNIGESLKEWAFSIRKFDDDSVTYVPKTAFVLPDFIDPDTAVLLTVLMMEKRTNEYRLRKLFGMPFKEKYGSIVQRLVNVGLLTRHLDGWLEINEMVVNDVGKLLSQKDFLRFYHYKY
jgi:hypothetical protein